MVEPPLWFRRQASRRIPDNKRGRRFNNLAAALNFLTPALYTFHPL
jgi:hypothetical protein